MLIAVALSLFRPPSQFATATDDKMQCKYLAFIEDYQFINDIY